MNLPGEKEKSMTTATDTKDPTTPGQVPPVVQSVVRLKILRYLMVWLFAATYVPSFVFNVVLPDHWAASAGEHWSTVPVIATCGLWEAVAVWFTISAIADVVATKD